MNFVILSNQQFDYPLKTNKWQIATRLAKLGHKVIFVDPPIRIRKAIKLVYKKPLLLIDLFRGYKKVSNNLYVSMPITLALSEKPDLFEFNFPRLSKLLSLTKFENTDFVLWVYNQVMTEYIDELKYKLMIYDCVDEYSKFPNFVERGLSEYVSEKEKYVAQKSQIVFATTESLVEKMKKFNNNVHFTPNVGDYERFKNVHENKIEATSEFRDIQKPIIGFTGAIDAYKVNISLLEKCAEMYPNYSFVIIGPRNVSDKTSTLENLEKCTNVHFLGEKPYETLPTYLEGFDAYIIPYNLTEYTVGGCFPIKFHDALSAGLPTVVTELPSYKPFNKVCYIAKNEKDFVTLIKKAVEEDNREKIAARKKVAKENSWEVKVENQLRIIDKSLGNK